MIASRQGFLAALAAFLALAAQDPQRPVFRSGVERVPVDVIVVGCVWLVV